MSTQSKRGMPQRLLMRRQAQHVRPARADYARFERCKADWIDANPEASPAAYTAAMKRIARECGV